MQGYAATAMPPARPPARPHAPLAPVLCCASLGGTTGATRSGVLDAGAVRYVTSGRIAIAMALREMGIGAGDTVLVPAYHSLSMIPPVLACGARPVFYKVGPDAAIDLPDVAARLDASVKAIMVTSYFGIPQQLDTVRAFCDQHGLLMLEDCAHCFFGEHQGRPVGSFGDYAIASSMKFFPIYEGGCLVSARHALAAPPTASAGRGFELKAGLNALENAFAYGRLPLLRVLLWLPLKAKDLVWALARQRQRAVHGANGAAGAAGATLAPSSSDSSFEFDPRWIDKRSSWFSRAVMARADQSRIVERRRANYQRLQAALAGLPGCRPLHPVLPEGACPWLFPLWVERPEALFAPLHLAGVPMTRFAHSLWPGVDAGVCANSVALSQHVIGFPCHQELRDAELGWIIATVTEALTA